jgi:hypothetical protein
MLRGTLRRSVNDRRTGERMDISGTSQSSADHGTGSTRKRTVALSSFAGGLSAWVGGVAFCVGMGVAAPTWVALPLTAVSVTAAGLSHTLLRRNTRVADGAPG